VRVHDGGADTEEAAVILERGDVDTPSVALERRDPVADDLGGLADPGTALR